MFTQNFLIFISFCSGNNSVFVAKTTLNIVVGEHIFGLVYGQDGRNLARLKEVNFFFSTGKEYLHVACSSTVIISCLVMEIS